MHFLSQNLDLDYLQTLASEMKVGSGRVADDDREGMLLAREAEAAVTFLCKRQEFWRQYKPMYSEEKKGGRRRRAVRRVRAP